jgi:hypothetical protein
MFTIELDPETAGYLTEILKQENTTPEALIKNLLHQRLMNLQSGKTLVERRGGHPENLLQDAPVNLSERENRKGAIAEYLSARRPQQFSQ